MKKKFENELEALTQISCDLNAIKCILITDFAERNKMNATELAKDIRKIYGLDEEEEPEDD